MSSNRVNNREQKDRQNARARRKCALEQDPFINSDASHIAPRVHKAEVRAAKLKRKAKMAARANAPPTSPPRSPFPPAPLLPTETSGISTSSIDVSPVPSTSPYTVTKKYHVSVLAGLRDQIENQTEELNRCKRTTEEMMGVEKWMWEEIQRLRTEKEQALEVLLRIQEEAIQEEGWDGAEHDLKTAAHMIEQHLKNVKTSRNHERLERQRSDEKLLEERESRSRDMINIQRECQEPFVVPALLQAFLKVSTMTDAVLES
ncbi:uncharacterized protein STEHIDRAFT_163544 [Stereum hirsutum FP-91666 SS1]|uniref:Uncharacterized protein n=1 Tax=Stereum hirsutum (strain FP-91666) TaxID=721885 RepID=R7RY47_STEHR|nr:uncharacterized protein STEHIDRAFT_163544 [Stereum hirsutum FP-91666 SS1]EIM79728.1 hypothetical protein STEHIDRAFT_163544 [Stereum hirsutum FP-91666 SS1]